MMGVNVLVTCQGNEYININNDVCVCVMGYMFAMKVIFL